MAFTSLITNRLNLSDVFELNLLKDFFSDAYLSANLFLAVIEAFFGQALRLIDLYVKEPKKFGLKPKGQESSEDFFLKKANSKMFFVSI